MEQEIVDGYLVENLLRQRDGGSFILENHSRPKTIVIKNTVCTDFLFSDLQWNFIGEQGDGVVLMLNEVMNEVLPDPFLWREYHIFSAEYVKNLLPSVHFLYPGLIGREI